MGFERFEDLEYQKWSSLIKSRDCYTCQVCGRRGGHLHAHHMNAWNAFPQERYNLKNGVTLCFLCHEKFHQIYGKGDNTIFQFTLFKRLFLDFRRVYLKLYHSQNLDEAP